jgi:2-hydroxyglutarate dehydrogenase
LRESDPPRECDVAVVGAGILGLAVARELLSRRPGARVCVLEREARIASHQTGHSSGVVHAGIYYEPGSLKARLCVRGAAELAELCGAREIPFSRSGKLIVAAGPGDLPALDRLERRGRENGVPGLRRIGPEEIAAIEPAAAGVGALHSPATAVVDFAAVAAALATDVEAAGGTIHTGVPVHPAAGDGGVALRRRGGATRAREAVFCAGLWADRLAVACGGGPDPRIVPFRGAYLRLRPERAGLVRGSVYPVPDGSLPFLGAHLTRTLTGGVLVGPSAFLAPARDAYALRTVRPRDLAESLAWPGTWRLARRHWRAALGEARRSLSRPSFVAEAARLVPSLAPADVVPGPAGIRAQALARDGTLVEDFVVHRTGAALHVRNAPSPAATAALPLARLIADRLDGRS